MTRRWRGDGAAMARRWRGDGAARWRIDGAAMAAAVRTVARHTMAAVAAPATGEGVCTTVRTYGGIQDRSSIGEKTRVTDSPRITSGKRFFFRLHILLGVWRFYAPT